LARILLTTFAVIVIDYKTPTGILNTRLNHVQDWLKCGGRVQFATRAIGGKVPCPHCQKILTLHKHENLKMPCFFLQGKHRISRPRPRPKNSLPALQNEHHVERANMNTLNQIQNWPERAKQANYCATTLAKHCRISLRTLERYWRKEFGQSPKSWLVNHRLEKADGMIKSGLSVKETAGNLGYEHFNNFSRDYKEHTGCCPTAKTTPIRPPPP
jgi:AraC-like DNA-binding protein